MTLGEIYKRSFIYPSLILLPLATVTSIMINRDYKSEWLTPGAAIEMDILIVLAYCCIMCVLGLTIFLNKYESIAANSLLSGLSCFAIPGGFICVVIGKALNEYLTVGTNEILYALTINLPFVAGLIWGFRKFREKE